MSPPPRAAGRPRPVEADRDLPIARPAPADEPTRGAPVLVVEHNPHMRRVLAEILTGRGYGVRTAGSGTEALQIAARVTPGLVLLDMTLPSMDGWSVARALSARTPRSPIIVMADASHALAWSHEVGGVEALGKPFAMDQLLAAADRHYRGCIGGPPADPAQRRLARSRTASATP